MTTPPPQDPRTVPPPAAEPAKRRRPPWAVLGCALLALLVLLGVGGCAAVMALRDDGEDVPATSAAPADDPAGADHDPQGTDGGPGDASGVPGTSWDNPGPLGGAAMVPLEPGRAFELTLGTPEWDVEQSRLEGGSGGEAPPEGQVYVLIPVTVSYHGDGAATYGGTTTAVYVDSTGTEHSEALGVTAPRPTDALPEFSDGTSAEFDLVFLLPEEEQGEGVIGLGPEGSPEERVFVQLG